MAITPQVITQMKVIEARLVWLVTVVAAVINGSSTDSRKDVDATDMLKADAKLCSYVFLLCRHMNERMDKFGAQGRSDERLENSHSHFFQASKSCTCSTQRYRIGWWEACEEEEEEGMVVIETESIPLGGGTKSLLSIAYAGRSVTGNTSAHFG